MEKRCTVCQEPKEETSFGWVNTKLGVKKAQCLECEGKIRRKWRREHKEEHAKRKRHDRLKAAYGLSLEDYRELGRKQEWCCLICTQKLEDKLVVDHDHKTGKIRGLLCSLCNTGIGALGDSAVRLQKAIKYLSDNA